MKKINLMRLVILTCVLIAVPAVCVKYLINDGGDSEVTQAEETKETLDENPAAESEVEESEAVAFESASGADIEMSEEFLRMLQEGFSVRYDGSELVFPCEYEDILENAEEWDIHANGLYNSAVAFGKEKLFYEIFLYVPLVIDGEIEILEETGCSGMGISLISAEEFIEEEAPELYLAGITWQSTEEELAETFGEAGYRNELTEDDGERIYTYLLYQADYEGRLYSMEFTIQEGFGVMSMSFYFIEE